MDESSVHSHRRPAPERPWVPLMDVYHHFGYKTQQSALTAIYNGTFPVPTFKMGHYRAIHLDVYHAMFDKHRDAGIAELLDL